MDQITLKNFRCFREEQTARLAPLTLLVGENSTGKTSFMAMIRALWDTVHGFRPPDFKEEPYDLGSFDDITHYRGGRPGRAETFEAGFKASLPSAWHKTGKDLSHQLRVAFGKRGAVPAPVRTSVSREGVWVETRLEPGQPYTIRFQTRRGVWEYQAPDEFGALAKSGENLMFIASYILPSPSFISNQVSLLDITPQYGSPPVLEEDLTLVRQLTSAYQFGILRPFASAPVRSKPRRTYDPARPVPDPEGDYVPMFLADAFSQEGEARAYLKNQLEQFGKAAGLFDEISIQQLGKGGSGPFQIHVRKAGGRLKGPLRNLIDVGYGVSQALPVITELLRLDAPSMFLLQQPEVHLHPKAQAALGSLFCQVARPERQLIIETHSDHLMDRVRMDVRDGASILKPEDVSILFFERDDLDVRIHSLRIDKEGNILDAPLSYRRFFMEEVSRSLRF